MSSWVNKLAKPPVIPGSINIKSGQIGKFKNNENNNILYRGLINAATTGPINLIGFHTVDGVSLVEGNIVLVKNQINKINNGIYRVTNGNWKRSKLLLAGVMGTSLTYLIQEGNTNKHTLWSCDSSINSTVGRDNLNFVKVIDNEGGGGGGSSNNVIIKKESDNSIQWKFEINNNNNDLEFYYSSDNGNSFVQKYIFSDN